MSLFIRFSATVMLFLFLAGCQAKSVLMGPAVEQRKEGWVFIYSGPFPQEAERLRFHVDKISAVRADESTWPLSVMLADFEIETVNRQRQAAAGRLPAGRYKGFSFTMGSASLELEEERADLLLPDKPVYVDFPFVVRQDESYMVSLVFNYADSVSKKMEFTPVFTAVVPEKPINEVLGYVALSASGNIMVFDKQTMEITGVIAVGRGPNGIALDQVRNRAYVTLSGEDAVEVIDMTSNQIINSIRLITGDEPREPALAPDGSILLTANSGSNTVSFINTDAYFEEERIETGDGPNSVIIDSSGKRAYVFNRLSNTISVIDMASKSVAATLSTDPGPLRGQLNDSEDSLYVIHESSAYLTVIDPLNLSVRDRIYVGMGMKDIHIDTRNDIIYISSELNTMTEVFGPVTSIPVDFIDTGGTAAHMSIDDEENNLYLLVPEAGELLVVNIVNNEVIAKMDVGAGACWVAVMGER